MPPVGVDAGGGGASLNNIGLSTIKNSNTSATTSKPMAAGSGMELFCVPAPALLVPESAFPFLKSMVLPLSEASKPAGLVDDQVYFSRTTALAQSIRMTAIEMSQMAVPACRHCSVLMY
ncbi:MAG: hypothetical protein KatS3mg024_0082 [Armatimonadota bacterium]|nr:MAG: hypothetical protein KatS3mg024_0082 [Armatimonadota bacterium]